MRTNPITHQNRLAMAGEIARKADGAKQALYDDLRRHEGAIGALKQAMDCVDAHKSFIKKDHEEEKISLEECKSAIVRVDEINGILHNLRETARINHIMMQGRHEQAGEFMSVCRTMFEEEKRTITAMVEELARQRGQEDGEIADGPPPAAGNGNHPGPSLAAQRRAQVKLVEEEADGKDVQ